MNTVNNPEAPAGSPAHTPGPWKLEADPESLVIVPEKSTRTCSYVAVLEKRGCYDDSERAANAFLVAAAPELKDALREFFEWGRSNFTHTKTITLPSGRNLHELLVEAHGVLAKAEGGAR